MAQQIMWSYTDRLYRGQAGDGTVVTVTEEAMDVALKKAGKGVFESDWWTETLTVVLEHWGIYGKRWADPATAMPRLHFVKGEPKPDSMATNPKMASSPLSTRILERKKEGQ